MSLLLIIRSLALICIFYVCTTRVSNLTPYVENTANAENIVRSFVFWCSRRTFCGPTSLLRCVGDAEKGRSSCVHLFIQKKRILYGESLNGLKHNFLILSQHNNGYDLEPTRPLMCCMMHLEELLFEIVDMERSAQRRTCHKATARKL